MADLVLIVHIGGRRVALPAAEVEGVIEVEALAPVPRAAAHVAGLSALRSRVLTAIDCLASIDPALRTGEASREAVVSVRDGHGYALLVGAVEDVAEALPGPGAALAMAPEWARVARGTVEAGGDLLLLADIEALVAGTPGDGRQPRPLGA